MRAAHFIVRKRFMSSRHGKALSLRANSNSACFGISVGNLLVCNRDNNGDIVICYLC